MVFGWDRFAAEMDKFMFNALRTSFANSMLRLVIDRDATSHNFTRIAEKNLINLPVAISNLLFNEHVVISACIGFQLLVGIVIFDVGVTLSR